MRITCIGCCKFKFASNGRATNMVAIGWTRLFLAGELYWICPQCSDRKGIARSRRS